MSNITWLTSQPLAFLHWPCAHVCLKLDCRLEIFSADEPGESRWQNEKMIFMLAR